MSLDDDSGSLSSAALPPTISLRCSDGKELTISRSAIKVSDLCKALLDQDHTCTTIDIKYFDSKDISHVIHYMIYHETTPARQISIPLRSTNMKDIVDAWDTKFVESLDQNSIFRLLMASNYLGVKDLVILLCAKVASLMKGKTPKAIRATLGIPEFNNKDLEEIRRSFPDLMDG